ncbi:MAG: hypothetical protein E5Y32_34715, partial [Mesorhizobium sp.]
MSLLDDGLTFDEIAVEEAIRLKEEGSGQGGRDHRSRGRRPQTEPLGVAKVLKAVAEAEQPGEKGAITSVVTDHGTIICDVVMALEVLKSAGGIREC